MLLSPSKFCFHLALHFLKSDPLNLTFELTRALRCICLATHTLCWEKHGTHLGKPVGVCSCHTLHILLWGHDQFVVDNIVRSEAQSVYGACWMKHTRDTRSQVHVLSNSLHSCCVMEVTWTDCLPDNVPINSWRILFNFQRFHNVQELGSHFSNFLQSFGMNEMFLGPFRIVFVPFPLVVDVE